SFTRVFDWSYGGIVDPGGEAVHQLKISVVTSKWDEHKLPSLRQFFQRSGDIRYSRDGSIVNVNPKCSCRFLGTKPTREEVRHKSAHARHHFNVRYRASYQLSIVLRPYGHNLIFVEVFEVGWTMRACSEQHVWAMQPEPIVVGITFRSEQLSSSDNYKGRRTSVIRERIQHLIRQT